MSIASRIHEIKAALPDTVTLVAVSKFHPIEDLQEAYDAGQRIFGESRAQELKLKHLALPKDIQWHFIGPLQRNKVKDIAPYVHLIQSVDSLRLLEDIDRQAAKHQRVINVLIEVFVAKEETKQGFSVEECQELLNSNWEEQFPNISILGLMGMATYTDDEQTIREEFATLRKLKEANPSLSILSMGMSDDYPLAIQEGSTMVRIGSSIFGARK